MKQRQHFPFQCNVNERSVKKYRLKHMKMTDEPIVRNSNSGNTATKILCNFFFITLSLENIVENSIENIKL